MDDTLATETVQITLTSANGTLTLSGTAGLDFAFADAPIGTGAGDGTDDATMTFRGTLAAVNTALGGLRFTPALNFVGSAAITIIANDLGNIGTGGIMSTTAVANITVTPVNDPPVNSVPAAQTTSEDVPLVFLLANGNQITVSDVDDGDDSSLGNEPVQVTLTAARNPDPSSIAGLSFGTGDGTADAT